MNQNMLSIKKVKLHGMTSNRWTTYDKITQYKGLINLYTRDRKIVEVDTAVNHKKQHKELQNLQKTVQSDRLDLDNAIRGDKQQLRNTLAEHREMQLAFQNSPPKKVIEYVHQINFTKRKVLDKLLYEMKIKAQKLIEIKLEKSILEDRLKYESYEQLPVEKESQIITGKVQEAILRKEAALSIRHIYAQIIAIMKKDALYFDAILITIKNDGLNQSQCLINATQLGQLATEYLDDRRNEYYMLEKLVIKDMTTRKFDLTHAQEQAEKTSGTLKQLLRRDSDVNTCMLKIDDTPSDLVLQKDLQKIESTLSFLKITTLVADFEAIFPCLQEQVRQKERLTELAKHCERSRDILFNKMNHAEVENNALKNSMVETTAEYKHRKKELREEIDREIEEDRQINILIKARCHLTAKVRICLRQLQQICKPVKVKEEDDGSKRSVADERARIGGMDAIYPPPPDVDESDGCQMIPTLVAKLKYLTANLHEKFEDSKLNEAYKYYEAMMKERSIARSIKEEITDDSLLEIMVLEISHVLTREDIKKQSDEIVAQNTKNDDMIPMFTVKKKKKKWN